MLAWAYVAKLDPSPFNLSFSKDHESRMWHVAESSGHRIDHLPVSNIDYLESFRLLDAVHRGVRVLH